jgi:hypothetical protein
MTKEDALAIVVSRWGPAGIADEGEDRWGLPRYWVGTKDGSRYGSGRSYESAFGDCDSR